MRREWETRFFKMFITVEIAVEMRRVWTVCREHGQFNWQTTGHVSNVGLMAQKAEEYEMCTYL